MTSNETHKQKRDRLAETVLGVVTASPDFSPVMAAEMFAILTAAAVARLEHLSLSDMNRVAETYAQTIPALARDFRKEKRKVFQ